MVSDLSKWVNLFGGDQNGDSITNSSDSVVLWEMVLEHDDATIDSKANWDLHKVPLNGVGVGFGGRGAAHAITVGSDDMNFFLDRISEGGTHERNTVSIETSSGIDGTECKLRLRWLATACRRCVGVQVRLHVGKDLHSFSIGHGKLFD